MDSKALELARKYKRLQSWKKRFEQKDIKKEFALEIQGKLQTYALLIVKVIKAKNEAELQEVQQRLSSIEREVSELFEQSRLTTSPMLCHSASSA